MHSKHFAPSHSTYLFSQMERKEEFTACDNGQLLHVHVEESCVRSEKDDVHESFVDVIYEDYESVAATVIVALKRKDLVTRQHMSVEVDSLALIKSFEDSLRASFELEGLVVNDDNWEQMLKAKKSFKAEPNNYFIL